MSIIWADRVGELTNDTGQGPLALIGNLTSYQTFAAAVGDGNMVYYSIVARTGGKWEVGLGTITLAGAFYYLVRSAPLVENGTDGPGALVDFSAGVKEIKLVLPASRVSALDASTSSTAVYASIAEAAASVAVQAALSAQAAVGLPTDTPVYLVSAFPSATNGKVLTPGSNITLTTAASEAVIALTSTVSIANDLVVNSSVSITGTMRANSAVMAGTVQGFSLIITGGARVSAVLSVGGELAAPLGTFGIVNASTATVNSLHVPTDGTFQIDPLAVFTSGVQITGATSLESKLVVRSSVSITDAYRGNSIFLGGTVQGATGIFSGAVRVSSSLSVAQSLFVNGPSTFASVVSSFYSYRKCSKSCWACQRQSISHCRH